ncbi:MAG TPA: hypothetical protein PLL30_11440 [Candidatus Krumholzibacteria bacterium]|nr:hypothetical protein [Candidatus Krumholzibacteria bacterium]HPD72378.1 hypothetical protein [Candidatus Krumholzibacteria bacterium]HRY40690.1 hypothetical protein [Candidatus Krumholzibacteria bacterium]
MTPRNRGRLIGAILLLAGTASAQLEIPTVWTIEPAYDYEFSVLMMPDGSGPALTEARGPGGVVVDAAITVRIGSNFGYVIQGFPPEDLWFQLAVEPGTAAGCLQYPDCPGGVFLPDGPTDADGYTTFSQPWRGGGWSAGPATLYINGWPATDMNLDPHDPVPFRANSPDLNGDLVVNLTDIVLFIQDLDGGAYRSDFNWDGHVNLSDMVTMAQAMGMACE